MRKALLALAASLGLAYAAAEITSIVTFPGGSGTNVQFHDDGVFGGVPSSSVAGSTVTFIEVRASTAVFGVLPTVSTFTRAGSLGLASGSTLTLGNGVEVGAALAAAGVSTAQARIEFTAVGVSTAQIRTELTAVGASTAALSASTVQFRTEFTAVGVSTAQHRVEFTAVGVSTAQHRIEFTAVGVSTAGLETSKVNRAGDTMTGALTVTSMTTTATGTGIYSLTVSSGLHLVAGSITLPDNTVLSSTAGLGGGSAGHTIATGTQTGTAVVSSSDFPSRDKLLFDSKIFSAIDAVGDNTTIITASTLATSVNLTSATHASAQVFTTGVVTTVTGSSVTMSGLQIGSPVECDARVSVQQSGGYFLLAPYLDGVKQDDGGSQGGSRGARAGVNVSDNNLTANFEFTSTASQHVIHWHGLAATADATVQGGQIRSRFRCKEVRGPVNISGATQAISSVTISATQSGLGANYTSVTGSSITVTVSVNSRVRVNYLLTMVANTSAHNSLFRVAENGNVVKYAWPGNASTFFIYVPAAGVALMQSHEFISDPLSAGTYIYHIDHQATANDSDVVCGSQQCHIWAQEIPQ